MIRHTVQALTGSLVLALCLGACQDKPKTTAPPVPVTVVPVATADVPLLLTATGTVEPMRTVSVQAQVSGMLTHVAFKEGDDVREGQILFEIDPRTYRAALDQAEASMAKDAIQLQTALRELARDEELAKKEYIPQQQLDIARGSAKSMAATLSADTAAATQARINLQYATVRAPITGRTGGLLVRDGNLVRTGSGEPLVVINQISPILARFPIPAVYFDQVRQRASKALDVVATPQGDSAKPQHGTLIFLDNAVDSTTNTILLKASFPNPGNALWPGELVRIALQLDVQKGALVVPAAAVQSGQSGNVIWIVDDSNKAKHRNVTVLRSTDSLAVLSGGVTPGERVVIDGQLRLTDGARITLKTDAKGGSRRGGAGTGDSAGSKGRGGGRKTP